MGLPGSIAARRVTVGSFTSTMFKYYVQKWSGSGVGRGFGPRVRHQRRHRRRAGGADPRPWPDAGGNRRRRILRDAIQLVRLFIRRHHVQVGRYRRYRRPGRDAAGRREPPSASPDTEISPASTGPETAVEPGGDATGTGAPDASTSAICHVRRSSGSGATAWPPFYYWRALGSAASTQMPHPLYPLLVSHDAAGGKSAAAVRPSCRALVVGSGELCRSCRSTALRTFD
jgi:hypothetical protein